VSSRSRTLVASLAALAALAVVASASARACRYDAATRAVFAPPGEATVYERLWVEDGRIMWTDLVTTAPCGAATVTNTDTIHLVPPRFGFFSEVTIDERTGRFAPGATREATGESEIEIVVSPRFGGGVTEVLGTSGDDTIAVGRRGIALNGDGDADVIFGVPDDSAAGLLIDAGPGDDLVTGKGGLGTGASTSAPLSLFGGTGVNQLVGGRAGDLLSDSLPGARNGNLRGMGGPDVLQGSPAHDVLQGGDGADRLTGSAGRDVLLGGRGPDQIDALDGERDVVVGGEGTDRARLDSLDRAVGVEARL